MRVSPTFTTNSPPNEAIESPRTIRVGAETNFEDDIVPCRPILEENRLSDEPESRDYYGIVAIEEK